MEKKWCSNFLIIRVKSGFCSVWCGAHSFELALTMAICEGVAIFGADDYTFCDWSYFFLIHPRLPSSINCCAFIQLGLMHFDAKLRSRITGEATDSR